MLLLKHLREPVLTFCRPRHKPVHHFMRVTPLEKNRINSLRDRHFDPMPSCKVMDGLRGLDAFCNHVHSA